MALRRLTAIDSVSSTEIVAMSTYAFRDFVHVSNNLDLAWAATTYDVTAQVVSMFGVLWFLMIAAVAVSEYGKSDVKTLSPDEKSRLTKRLSR